jgi:hypothetical protein
VEALTMRAPCRNALVSSLITIAALTASARAEPDDDLDRDLDAPVEVGGEAVVVTGRGSRGPAISAVLVEAYAMAGLDRSPTRGLIRRARLGGLVPWITVRTGRDYSWQTSDPEVDNGMALEVRATWRLDRLVFDGRELQVAGIEAARRRERRDLSTRVIRVYFAWQRAAAQPGGSLRAAEAAAELDALTGGYFSQQLR